MDEEDLNYTGPDTTDEEDNTDEMDTESAGPALAHAPLPSREWALSQQVPPSTTLSPAELALRQRLTPQELALTQRAPPSPMGQPLVMQGGQGAVQVPPQPGGYENAQQLANRAMWQQLRYKFAQSPLAETEAAVSAALKYQALRAYQNDVAGGTNPGVALSRVAPSLYTGKENTLGSAAQFIKNTQPQPDESKFINVHGILYRVSSNGSVIPLTPRPVEKLDAVDQGFLKSDLAKLKEIQDDPKFALPNAAGEDLRRRAHDIRNNITIKYRQRVVAPPQPGGPIPTAPVVPVPVPRATPIPQVAPSVVATATPTVTSKDQFDRLSSGTIYIGKNGRKYRKP